MPPSLGTLLEPVLISWGAELGDLAPPMPSLAYASYMGGAEFLVFSGGWSVSYSLRSGANIRDRLQRGWRTADERERPRLWTG